MFLSAVLAALTLAAPPDPPKPFEFKDGDRIVWLGNTPVEREQRYGYWETALIAANADKKLTVRNLGWSGDTVFGDARAGFDNAAKGFERMVSLTLELKPTVIFISYGTNESFEGKEGLPKFEKGLEKLLDALKPAGARIVLFKPAPFGRSESLPNPAERNANLWLYWDTIRKVGSARNHSVIDPMNIPVATAIPRLTENGMHLTEEGYQFTARTFLMGFQLATFLDNNPALDFKKLEPLRQAIVAKNEQFFNKWRPQNETYLFGFRKHEQGKNAKEIVEFDPFIAKAEDEIDKLRKALRR